MNEREEASAACLLRRVYNDDGVRVVGEAKAASIFGREVVVKNEYPLVLDLLATDIVENTCIFGFLLIRQCNVEKLACFERPIADLIEIDWIEFG